MRFIENKENIIFVGSPGVGKTHLATTIGITATQNRNFTYFINCNDLIANLKKANFEKRFINQINHYAKYKVLVIDEVGFLPVDPEGAKILFQLINKRYEKHSTIITTNKPFGKWHEIFNDVTLANAILDRLLHHFHIININGNSYRLKEIDNFCKENLKVELNAKTQIGKVKNGIDFLGFRLILTETGKVVKKLRGSSKIRFKRYLKNLKKLKKKGVIDTEYVNIRRNSFASRIKRTDESRAFLNKIMSE